MNIAINKEEEQLLLKKIGGKALNLIKLHKEGFNVPKFVVVSNELYNVEINESEFLELLNLEEDGYYSVRSSATNEDGKESSFAGQYETFLYVKKEEIIEHIKKIWLSSKKEHIKKYIETQNIDVKISEKEVPAIIIQKMINSRVSGITFSKDPINATKNIIVTGTYGLGSCIVNGEVDGDMFVLKPNLTIESEVVSDKNIMHKQSVNGGIEVVEVEREKRNAKCLTNKEILNIAQKAQQIEEYYKFPQDIEWAIEGAELYILQSRPITTLASNNINDIDNTIIWDNSNIVESYSGITLPLTFSFIKIAYSNVYDEFSKLMKVSKKKRIESRPVFNAMIGYLQGRVYYNLVNWYKLILLFPGFGSNKKFMEQMMGVKEEINEDDLKIEKMNFFQKMKKKLSLIRVFFAFLFNFIVFDYKVKRFLKMVDKYIDKDFYKISQMNDSKSLVNTYKKIESEVLFKWDAPIINDFFAMIFFGLLKKLIDKWHLDDTDSLHNELLSQEQQLFSAEPFEYIKKMNEILKSDKELMESIEFGDLELIEEAKKKNKKFNELYEEYMNKFGDRSICELKLESPMIEDNPMLLYNSILGMRHQINTDNTVKDRRKLVEKEVFEKLGNNKLRKLIFRIILKYAKKHIATREYLRYERTKAFAKVRKIFRKIAYNFHNEGIIKETEAIFYLEINEIFGMIDGTSCTKDLSKVMEIRKNEIERFSKEKLPDRFKTRGLIVEKFIYSSLDEKVELNETTKKGIGCCAGIVKGKVQIVINPMETIVEKDAIVITKSTDPGWIMVFPLMKGLIVEKGSLLSHSAIISREIGLPTIVSVTGATEWLQDGDII